MIYIFMSEPRKLRVFLCHASQDKPVVRELYQRLNSEGWIDPWLDEEKLLPGQDWDIEITNAVQKSDVVIVCLSNNSVTKRGYVQKELKLALDVALEEPYGNIFIIPLRLDECPVLPNLAKWHWIDYFIEPNEFFLRLKQSLRIRVNSLGLLSTMEAWEENLPPDIRELLLWYDNRFLNFRHKIAYYLGPLPLYLEMLQKDLEDFQQHVMYPVIERRISLLSNIMKDIRSFQNEDKKLYPLITTLDKKKSQPIIFDQALQQIISGFPKEDNISFSLDLDCQEQKTIIDDRFLKMCMIDIVLNPIWSSIYYRLKIIGQRQVTISTAIINEEIVTGIKETILVAEDERGW